VSAVVNHRLLSRMYAHALHFRAKGPGHTFVVACQKLHSYPAFTIDTGDSRLIATTGFAVEAGDFTEHIVERRHNPDSESKHGKTQRAQLEAERANRILWHGQFHG